MNKQEFLDKLRIALSGKVSAGAVTENINYYENYINTEMRMGRSEEEVLASLGDPRLIAKTIVETNPGRGEQTYQQEEAESTQVNHRNYQWLVKIPGWVWLTVLGIVIIMILGIVFKVLTFFAPILIVLAIVMYLAKIFRD